MNSFLIISILSVTILIILLVFIAIIPDKNQKTNDNQFLNKDGDHIYYDRHLIRYKENIKQSKQNKTNSL